MSKFESIEYEDDYFAEKDWIFAPPSRSVQEHLLEVFELCKWDIRELMQVLSVSKSTCNNILGNDSMTNSKPTPICKRDLITILMCIQNAKVEKDNLLLVFYLFSILCTGMSESSEFEPFKNLYVLENKIPYELLLQNLVHFFPNIIRNFNRFIEWRFNAPNVSITEYYGHPELNEYIDLQFNNTEPLEDEIKKSKEYIKKFIPLYLDWYVSKICKWIV